MNKFLLTASLVAGLVTAVAASAHADCKADLATLDQAIATKSLAPEAKTGLQAARDKVMGQMKSNDNGACAKTASQALASAGIKK